MKIFGTFVIMIIAFVAFLVLAVLVFVKRLIDSLPSNRRKQTSSQPDEERSARRYVNRKIDKSKAEDVSFEEV